MTNSSGIEGHLHNIVLLILQLRPDDSIMAKTAEKEIKAVQDYIRKLSIVSTKGPQANAPMEFLEEKADPQVMSCIPCKKYNIIIKKNF